MCCIYEGIYKIMHLPTYIRIGYLSNEAWFFRTIHLYSVAPIQL